MDDLVITAIVIKPELKSAYENATKQLRRIAHECSGGGWTFIDTKPIEIGDVLLIEQWKKNDEN